MGRLFITMSRVATSLNTVNNLVYDEVVEAVIFPAKSERLQYSSAEKFYLFTGLI